ncbi:MAG: hypothetical protein KKC29_02830 [Alphaproteobacteria bacterium]|jgi:tRNA(Ile)-lysidine synthase TilS/MesJ|nr:hypothetical protein [Alphaproteobacteria bacterium]MBU2041352.1 hypothetical protein [Alphaproteobacteria bacterium]MBU2125381.1 hypothetical protein [Alphaproteobacteria bacterium]MBU2209543.1 hypothetical protein [Alphaproteobacteria bacterium]MBU2290019.1 hypothetical protein [Alphaproteobacteria bacterium]
MTFVFRTAHGDYQLDPTVLDGEADVEMLLKVEGIPSSSTSLYGKRHHSEALQLIGTSRRSINSLISSFDEILIRPDRNIDYASIIGRETTIATTEEPVASYNFVSHGSDAPSVNKEFSQAECRDFVAKNVCDFLDKITVDERPIVVGVSGGGDSNTLLHALAADSRISVSQLVPVMMLGIPDWDRGVDRAREICADLGLELRIVDRSQVNKLLGRSGSDDWPSAFEAHYPDTDLEVIGTLAVRLALSHVARDVGAQAAVTGLNIEDLLSECLLSVFRGRPPLPFPVRTIDGVDIWYPLYRTPKRLIDGCNPKFSLQNYDDRYPSVLYWRALSYYSAQQLATNVPGLEFVLLDGFQALATATKRTPVFSESLGFSAASDLADENIAKWQTFLASQ